MIPFRGWLLIATLFLTSVLVVGSCFTTLGVFFDPLMRQFHWSHAQVSLFATLVALMMAFMGPVTGWLLERSPARFVIGTGSALCAIGLITASQTSSYHVMLAAYLFMGMGIGLSCLTAVAVVIGKSFDASQRGKALGVAMSGNGAGGLIMIPIVSVALAHLGWRMAYLTLAAPIIVIVLPLVFLFVDLKPGTSVGSGINVPDEGLDVKQALHTSSLWLIMTITFLFSFAVSMPLVHLIPYLIHFGYQPERAALAMSLLQGITCLGTIAWGTLIDRFGARTIMGTCPLIAAAGLLALIGVGSSPAFLYAFILLVGLVINAMPTVMPLMLVEALGVKRFATFSGTGMFVLLIALAVGPLVAGRVVDVTGEYSTAFIVGAVAALCAAGLTAAIPRPRFRFKVSHGVIAPAA